MQRPWIILLGALLLALPSQAAVNPADYEEVSQSELVRDREAYHDKKIRVTGALLFSGSDFCYEIRKTKINTRDYFCFALGTPSLVRMYLKKDHPQADQLLNIKPGQKVTAYGVFDSRGADYSFVIVDEIRVEPHT